MSHDAWERYVKRMMHKPNSGISPDQGKVHNANAKTGQQVPELIHVGSDYSRSELIDKIDAGAPIIDRLDPKGPAPPLHMPPFKDRLTRRQMDDLVAYLDSLLPPEKPGEAW